MDCNSKNYFYQYKKDRVRKLKDDEVQEYEEPIHLRLLREGEENK